MGQIFAHDKQIDDKQGELKIIEAMTLEYPQNDQFCNYAADLYAVLNNFDMAAFYSKKLYMLTPNDQIMQTICQLYLRADEPEKALPNINYLPAEQQNYIKDRVVRIINDKLLLKKQPNNHQAKQRIAANYKQLNIDNNISKYSR